MELLVAPIVFFGVGAVLGNIKVSAERKEKLRNRNTNRRKLNQNRNSKSVRTSGSARFYSAVDEDKKYADDKQREEAQHRENNETLFVATSQPGKFIKTTHVANQARLRKESAERKKEVQRRTAVRVSDVESWESGGVHIPSFK